MYVLRSIILVFAFSCASHAYTQNSESKYVVNKIDSLLQASFEQGIFNGVAMVRNNDHIIYQKSFGLSDRSADIQLSLDDKFCIASLTKQFTSALIFILHDHGALSLEDKIGDYLRTFDSREYEGVTIKSLLNHTSGMESYQAYNDFDFRLDYPRDSFLTYIRRPLMSVPGEEWHYSNTGYYLLGRIIEISSGKSFSDALSEYILNPLGLDNTGLCQDITEDSLVKGYWRTIDGWEKSPVYSYETLFSSGGMYSTASDLMKWVCDFPESGLLSDSLIKEYFTPYLNDYAHGWHVKKGEGFERHFHGGLIKGYHSFILNRVSEKQTIILLDNSYSQEIQTIKNRIWSILVGDKLKPIKPKLSNILFEKCSLNELSSFVRDSLSVDFEHYNQFYIIDEYDINVVGYRLMDAGRFNEALTLFIFNMKLFPESWNVYDSIGELYYNMKSYKDAQIHYLKSLDLNGKNQNAEVMLKKIEGKL